MCLRLRLCPRLLCTHWNTEGQKKTQKQKGRDDDKCRGVYTEWSSYDEIAIVQILLTAVFTFSVSLLNKPQKKHPVFPVTCTLLPPSPPIAFPPLQPSSTSICPTLQNVMRQACGRKHGSGVLRGRGLLLTGEILLIKETFLVSV